MDENLETSERYTGTTNRAMMLLQKLPGLEISPMKLEYMMSNYFPGIGMYLMAMADATVRVASGENVVGTRSDFGDPVNLPILRGTTTPRTGGHQQRFYNLKNDVDSLMGSLRKLRRDGKEEAFKLRREAGSDMLRVRGAVNALARKMKRYRDSRDAVIRDQTLGYSERREKLDMLEALRDRELAIVPALEQAARGR
jgi:hypothetical protein